MSDATVTVVGRLTAKPTYGHTKNNDVFANFDVAVNHGYYDRERKMYIETGASFFSVSTFRNLAINAIESLERGTPVIVQGRLRLVKWESNDKQGMTARIEANSVGPDLNWGQADYTNIKRPRLEGDDPMDDPNVLGATPGDPQGFDSEPPEDLDEDVDEAAERIPAVLSA
ncbi:single-stranded DNA-binding protein [Ornithinimicrobium faecis]|uniref:Single-stranded DNA-binding protein n=1 Tax=Ornithinimicrobium faecis TaxID=2934158 RepID=A0ABY4YQG2_9MICO|nr:single-stranded DNA-binding protein [Ornithinimicrobium sp. HY1793]USQ79015.1 single-stranded DNA-binding protein [Ornithinimicrobium sp. HY1793]